MINLLHRFYIYLRLFFYSLVGPFLPKATCRFVPTCSHYCREAVTRRGFIVGGLLCLSRVLRCHPLSKGGFDPVPPASPPLN